MRYAILTFFAVSTAFGAGWNVSSNTLAQIKAARGAVTCESRRAVTIDGVKHWIEDWRRGEYRWSVTNRAYTVKGAYQSNVWQDRIAEANGRLAEARAELDETRARLTASLADLSSATGRTARIEAWVTEQRDRAVLPTTKAIWQSILDKLHGDD